MSSTKIEIHRFGEKLRRLRQSRGMTLKGLAASLGYTSHGHISEIEVGKKTPTAGFSLAVAKFFRVSIDTLLNDNLDISITVKQMEKRTLNALVPLADRKPSDNEIERFRLIISTYQDGTGMLANSDGTTLPGWRDFERCTALAFSGLGSESKDIFDVRLPDPGRIGVYYGISCKMRRELSRIDRYGRVTIELSNSARKFWNHLNTKGLDQGNYKQNAPLVGQALLELVTQWHHVASFEQKGNVDLSKSFYFTLSWNKQGLYQLHQFPLDLPDPRHLTWTFPTYEKDGTSSQGNHLRGDDETGTIIEWYGESGGQLKYYPRVADAVWESSRFKLEPLPSDLEHGIIHKAETYFPQQWAAVQQSELY